MDNLMKQFAIQMIQNSGRGNTPMGQEALRILNSNDEQAGIQMANNLCNSNGVSPQDVLPEAGNFFKNMLMGGMRR